MRAWLVEAFVPKITQLHLNTSGRDRNAQHDYALAAHHPKTGEYLGHLSYSEFRGRAHINMVEVPAKHQRRGIGTHLLRRLHRYYHPRDIRPGLSTGAGSALLASYARKYRD